MRGVVAPTGNRGQQHTQPREGSAQHSTAPAGEAGDDDVRPTVPRIIDSSELADLGHLADDSTLPRWLR
jgi:hypothetical protein